MSATSHRPHRLTLALVAVLGLVGAGLASGPSVAADGDPSGFSLAGSQPEMVSRVSADKAPMSALARTPASLRSITSAKPIPVLIKYDFDALASYSGTLHGLSATSPSVTGKSLTKTSTAAKAYLKHTTAKADEISSDIADAVPAADITGTFQVVYGGVSAIIPGNSVDKILAVPGVVAVQKDSVRHPLTDSSTTFINAPAAYGALHTKRNAGAGLLLGNIDSGVWPEHPSFADQGNLPAANRSLPCQFGTNPLTGIPFTCNRKLVGGEAFLDTYDLVKGDAVYPGTARDADGHGSHTASTSAGNEVKHVQTIGPEVAKINGVAPGAQVMEYRVCNADACYSSDSMNAVEQAILDHVNAINYSISGGGQPLTDPVELAFLDAYSAGVFVAASAGNSGPGAATTDHLGPWVTTVGASTQTREFASHLTLKAGSDTFTATGSSITDGAGPAPVVWAKDAPYGDVLCQTPAPAGTFTGKIVACQRGVNARVDKSYNVKQGGAAGMILYNATLADTETDNHWVPTVHLADGSGLVAFLTAHSGTAITGSFTEGAAAKGHGDVMAAFSSRGPGGVSIKPDITAPGVQILAAMTPTPQETSGGPPGQYYQAIAGTSMSSPHIAGAALLIKAVHPTWTPGQIKSAIMTQAITSVVKEDLTTPADPFDMGSGRVDIGRALKAPVTISDTASNFAALTGDPLHAVDLNIASIDAPLMPGRLTTSRTLQNVTGKPLSVNATARTGAGTKITFSPSHFTIKPGGSKTVGITITSTAPQGAQQFAAVTFKTNRGAARLPVAYIHTQGDVALTQSCDAASIATGKTATCTVSATNNSFDDQDVSLATSTNKQLKVVGANGAKVSHGVAKKTATLAGAVPGLPSVAEGESPAGYLPLSLFGITPTALGDEDLINFNVPTFTFNGQVYDAVGVDSNGYLVAGGGTSADNNCCDIPDGPSAERPNNILAPFWTDLTGDDTDGLRIATLTDGVSTWLVVEWQMTTWGSANLQTFQTWIGLNGSQDISYTYDPGHPVSADGQPFLVGAENVVGQGQMTADLPGAADLVVTSTDPEPGDVVSYTVTVKGACKGVGNVHTEMNASGIRGTTIVDTRIAVTKR